MRIYLAGAMTWHKNFNFPLFHKTAAELRAQGHTVINPAEIDEAIYGPDISISETGDPKDAAAKGFNLGEALLADITVICRDVEAIALLPGWEKSKGANLEKAFAEHLGRKVIFL